MRPVLPDIGGVHAEHVGPLVDTVNQNIVHNAAAAVGHARILHLPVVELRHVVGGDPLQQVERPGSLDPDFAHVAHVEDAGLPADGHVFVVDAREFDRHIVSREFGHPGPRGDMVLGEYGGFHSSYAVFGFGFPFSPRATRGASRPAGDSDGTPSRGRTDSGTWCASCASWRRRRSRSCGSSPD